MPLVLAIEPDARQGAVLQRIVHDHVHAELLLVDSPDAAVASLATHIPDVILVSMLLAPADEEDLIERLRSLDGGRHIQTYTIPQFASTPGDLEDDASGRFLGKLRKKKGRAVAHTPGCDPDLFATEVVTFLSRAQELKEQSEGDAARMLRLSPREAAAESSVDGGSDVDTPDAAVAEDSSWASPFEWRRTAATKPTTKSAKARVDRPGTSAGESLAEQERITQDLADAGPVDEDARESAGIAAEAITQGQAEEDQGAATEEALRLEALARAEEARLEIEREAALHRVNEDRLVAEFEAADRREREARERAEAEAALAREAEVARLKREAQALAQQEREAQEAEAAAARVREELERGRQAAEAEATRRMAEEVAAARERAELEQLRERHEIEQREREASERQRLDAEAAQRAEAERREVERLEIAHRAEVARLEAERLEIAHRAQVERLEAERLEVAQRAEVERLAAEQQRLAEERERLAAERADCERMQAERQDALSAPPQNAARLAGETTHDALVDPEQIRRERLAAAQETARRRREDKARKAAAARLRRPAHPARPSAEAPDRSAGEEPPARTGEKDPYAEFREDHDHPRGPLRLLPVDGWARLEQPKPGADVADESSPLHGLIAGLSVPTHVAVISYPRGCRIRRVRVRPLIVSDDELGQPVIVSRSVLDASRSATQATQAAHR